MNDATRARASAARIAPFNATARPPVRPSQLVQLVRLVQRTDRLLAGPALLGLLVRELLGPELDLAALGVNVDGVALLVLAGEHLVRERVEDELLDRPLDRPRPIDRVVALVRDGRLGGRGELDVDLPLLEPLRERLELELDDRFELLLGEAVEDHGLVDPVEELRPELPAQRVHDVLAHELVVLAGELADERRADVAGHDEDDVLEAHGAALAVGEPSVVADLEQDVEDVGV